jgi:hypothetical protein
VVIASISGRGDLPGQYLHMYLCGKNFVTKCVVCTYILCYLPNTYIYMICNASDAKSMKIRSKIIPDIF